MSEQKPLFGPGSQPISDEDGVLDYMEMPSSMATFSMPDIPEPEDTIGMEQGKARLAKALAALSTHRVENPSVVIELNDLSKQDLGLVNQILGEGEVAIVAGSHIQAQESVLAGVWRVHIIDENGQLVKDQIEIGACPDTIMNEVFRTSQQQIPPLEEKLPQGVFNAPSLVSELADKVKNFTPGQDTHAINLTLLPQTTEDLDYLYTKLGYGQTTILSRGYGNCRITSTGTKNVWWVQYFNSQDTLILNSIEVVEMPEVVKAAQEDIDESADRLREILEVYQ